MSAKPLTGREINWLNDLERVMNERPTDRLHCYTTGDYNLSFFDKDVSDKWELDNPREQLDAGELHQKAGSHLGEVSGRFFINSCAG